MTRVQPDFCSVVEPIDPAGECEAPAGYGVNGGFADGTKKVATKCYSCGEIVCRACSKMMPWKDRLVARVCGRCIQQEEKL